jgi:hypothetical protein
MLWLVYSFHVDKDNAHQPAGAMGYNPTVEEWEFLNPAGQAQGWLAIATMAQNRSALFSNATEEQQNRPRAKDSVPCHRWGDNPTLCYGARQAARQSAEAPA